MVFFRGSLIGFGGCKMMEKCFNDLFILNLNNPCPNSCSGNGECKDKIGCVCKKNFISNDCSMKKKCKEDCNRNGICLNNGKCGCFSGWSGITCDYLINCPKNCTAKDNGFCELNGKCKCNIGYSGEDCSENTTNKNPNPLNIFIDLNVNKIEIKNSTITPKPVVTRIKPVPTPVKPIATPVKPIATPIKPLPTPIKPVPIPIKQVPTPVKPVLTPIKPVTTPVKPVLTPIKPIVTPTKSVPTPIKQVPTPIKQVPTPIKPSKKIKPNVPVMPVIVPIVVPIISKTNITENTTKSIEKNKISEQNITSLIIPIKSDNTTKHNKKSNKTSIDNKPINTTQENKTSTTILTDNKPYNTSQENTTNIDNKTNSVNKTKLGLNVNFTKGKRLTNLTEDRITRTFIINSTTYLETKDCSKNCSQKGICLNSTCLCNQGFTGDTCSDTYKDYSESGYSMKSLMKYFVIVAGASMIGTLVYHKLKKRR